MLSKRIALEPGDAIEIRYRLSRELDGEREIFDRWLAAEVIRCEPDMWPLARLSDGQLTEIRSFMDWRFLPGYRRRVAA